ncbi:hypothetical protein H4R19_003433 [Coemansia spiralis]|nr:hypothetical protein H4R19_003433 [Coemansia spiralis]
MSATVTVSALPGPLYLYGSRTAGVAVHGPRPPGDKAYGAHGGAWPLPSDIDALACRLRATAQISDNDSDISGSAISDRDGSTTPPVAAAFESRLVFDADALCGDGPYVQVDHISSPLASSGSSSSSSIRCYQMRRVSADEQSQVLPVSAASANRRASSGDGESGLLAAAAAKGSRTSPLIRPQPRSNPFKTMMRTAAAAAVGDGAVDSCKVQKEHSNRRCVHCKSGNFLEFCYAADQCRCACHQLCPCNPCLCLRRMRSACQPPPTARPRLGAPAYGPLPAAAPLLQCAERK